MAKKHMREMLTIFGHKENENQTTQTFHLTPVRIATITNINNKCWQGCGGKGTLITASGNVS
jgi:hypothetical protein